MMSKATVWLVSGQHVRVDGEPEEVADMLALAADRTKAVVEFTNAFYRNNDRVVDPVIIHAGAWTHVTK